MEKFVPVVVIKELSETDRILTALRENGITPALGSNVAELCKEACKAAKAKGVKISCDLNYRGKLWTREQARAVMTDLCRYVDVGISPLPKLQRLCRLMKSPAPGTVKFG